MDVTFDTDKRGGRAPQTRIYAPSSKSSSELRFESDEVSALHPQPRVVLEEREQERKRAKGREKAKTPVYSYILLMLSVFLIAATAIIAISGNAKVADIYKEIYSVEDEIADYNEQISMLKKEQSSLNDYATINTANEEAGRTMNWDESKILNGN